MTEKMEKSNRTFDFFTDPGHGWIKVPKALLKELGIAEKITKYSYQRGEFAYLEEDCDATVFADALEKRTGCKLKFQEHTADHPSRIRKYETYSAGD